MAEEEKDSEKASEKEEVEERQSPSSRILHDAILAEGFEELERPTSALAWSGLAAGLSMGFSLFAEGLLRSHLPDSPWRPLVAKFGYSVGFLIVILGRQQLFTENTLTPILPLLLRKDVKTLLQVARLWAVVLVTNLMGGVLVGLATAKTAAFEPHVRYTFLEIAREAMTPSFMTLLWRGVFAGWLIALIVWVLPFAEAARFWVILIFAYVVGVGQLSHVIAGSIEVFTLAAAGEIGWGTALGGYTAPALIGNIIGGIALVALVNHGQAVGGEEHPDEK